MAGRRWIRLDVGWDNSEWVVALSPAGQLAWIKLLCYVKAHGISGRAKALPAGAVHKRWDIPREDFNAMLEAAQSDNALTLDDGDWVIPNWGCYQEPDRTAAERQRRHRADKSRLSPLRRDNRNTPLQPVTGGVTRRVTETETETSKKKPSAKKKPLPDDWAPNDAHRRIAADEGIDIERQVVKFRDHALANGRKQIDWDAAFRQWLRNANDFGPRKAQPQPTRYHLTPEQIRAQYPAA